MRSEKVLEKVYKHASTYSISLVYYYLCTSYKWMMLCWAFFSQQGFYISVKWNNHYFFQIFLFEFFINLFFCLSITFPIEWINKIVFWIEMKMIMVFFHRNECLVKKPWNIYNKLCMSTEKVLEKGFKHTSISFFYSYLCTSFCIWKLTLKIRFCHILKKILVL